MPMSAEPAPLWRIRTGGYPVVEPTTPFGAYLRALREQRGWGQAMLARAMGLHASYLSRLEIGERVAPDPSVVAAFARVLLLSRGATDALYALAGYLPPSLAGLDWSDPVVAAVLRGLVAGSRAKQRGEDAE